MYSICIYPGANKGKQAEAQAEALLLAAPSPSFPCYNPQAVRFPEPYVQRGMGKAAAADWVKLEIVCDRENQI